MRNRQYSSRISNRPFSPVFTPPLLILDQFYEIATSTMKKKSTHTFPKLIHMIWLSGYSDPKFQPWYASNMASWKKHNEGWELKFWDKEKLADFIGKHYPDYLPVWLDLDKPIKQCDMARYLLLHHLGGLYADMDTTCIRPIDTLLKADSIYNRTWTKTVPPTIDELTTEEISSRNFNIIFSHEESSHFLRLRSRKMAKQSINIVF